MRGRIQTQVEQIIISIRSFGFTKPILVDRNGLIIAGHGRWLAAKEMGLTEVPTIVLHGSATCRSVRCVSLITRSL